MTSCAPATAGQTTDKVLFDICGHYCQILLASMAAQIPFAKTGVVRQCAVQDFMVSCLFLRAVIKTEGAC